MCASIQSRLLSSLFFFNDTATTEIYTLSLHDALPIYARAARGPCAALAALVSPLQRDPLGAAHRDRDTGGGETLRAGTKDRKSTRLNSSHSQNSYAVFCLKKKKHTTYATITAPDVIVE